MKLLFWIAAWIFFTPVTLFYFICKNAVESQSLETKNLDSAGRWGQLGKNLYKDVELPSVG